MTAHERRAWLVVATLFTTLLFVFGAAFFTAGIFFTPLIHQFGWSRAELSAVTSALLVTTGLSAPVFGWILDQVDARVLMTAGVALSGVAFVGASRIHTFAALFIFYILLGLGVGASSLLPATFVVANWFEAGRGLAMGITTAGTSVGGMVMTLVANWAIRFGGWRFGFVLLALPMFVIVIPLVALTLRSRPAERDRLVSSTTSDTTQTSKAAAASSSRRLRPPAECTHTAA
jgi:sugar phosphate permease